jgi:hypothetical protein
MAPDKVILEAGLAGWAQSKSVLVQYTTTICVSFVPSQRSHCLASSSTMNDSFTPKLAYHSFSLCNQLFFLLPPCNFYKSFLCLQILPFFYITVDLHYTLLEQFHSFTLVSLSTFSSTCAPSQHLRCWSAHSSHQH